VKIPKRRRRKTYKGAVNEEKERRALQTGVMTEKENKKKGNSQYQIEDDKGAIKTGEKLVTKSDGPLSLNRGRACKISRDIKKRENMRGTIKCNGQRWNSKRGGDRAGGLA